MIRTRFAPSPTGYLHVGGLRTALYCYLFAKKNEGKFILRIEDTDQTRAVEGAMKSLIETMNWIGLEYDEGPRYGRNCGKLKEKGQYGPYIQSMRTDIYKEHVQVLLDTGHAYHCFCTKERLNEMREIQSKNKQAPMYDRKCLDMPKSEIDAKLKAGEAFVIRQKMPHTMIQFKDMVRGNVQFDGKTVDDQVLIKSDGFPTYHLANVVDDHLMEITHVIRGEEWLPSTPKHIALYLSFGWNPPRFAHIPLLLNPDKTKLSKRQGDVAIEDYIQKGYLKEAIINFVAFLGWHPGGGENREIYTLKELEELFDMAKVHKSGAIFNIEKLDWYNHQWQKKLYEEATGGNMQKRKEYLAELVDPYLDEKLKSETNLLQRALITVEDKILKNPKEVNEQIQFYFDYPEYPKELLTHEKMNVNLTQAKESIQQAIVDLEKLTDFEPIEAITQALFNTIERLGIKNGQVLWPVRAALSGQEYSPGAFEAAWALGKETTLNRLNQALQKL